MTEATAQRDPLKEIPNGTAPSRIKPPTKFAKEDFPVQTAQMQDLKENVPNNSTIPEKQLKRKKTEADLREELAQRKLNNTTTLSTVKKTKVDMSQTLQSRQPTRAVAKKEPVKPALNRTTRVAVKPAVPKASAAAAAPGKRPAWDIKGRLQDTENLVINLQSTLSSYVEKMESMTGTLRAKDNELTQVASTKEILQHDVEKSRTELHNILNEKLELQNQLVSVQQQCNMRIQELMAKQQSLEISLTNANTQLQMSRAENDGLKLTIQSQTSQLASVTAELDAVKLSLQTAQNQCATKQKQIEELQITLDAKCQQISELEAKIREDEALRKKLHNTIQELKGNIRVYCRVRPFVGNEIAENGSATPAYFEFNPHNDRTIEIVTQNVPGVTGKMETGKRYPFTFDKVFQPHTSQETCFQEISQLVQSALDGYNTCIFAYGQTGSGKTFTMEGAGYDAEIDLPIVNREQRGMIPRAVEQIFISAEALKEKGWEYEMEAMFIEIYNEQLRDLLCTKPKEDVKYEIKHDQKGNTTVTNMTSVKVRNPTQVYELLRRSASHRVVAKTNMNHHSSRSHSVFQLKLRGTNKITNEQTSSTLSLIDLAGSEKLDQSGSTGQRLKETQHINLSLTHLGDVIAALSNKDAHIPYRNSKLTYLLQNSLGGNSKTLMFVNISPKASDLNETINSLRFATKVNACEIGTAKRQTKIDLKN